jgi:hypothetical protein
MIANSNTKKIHQDDCSFVRLILKEHKVTINNMEDAEEYSPCTWCYGPDERSLCGLESFTVESCTDPMLRKLMTEAGCHACGSQLGDVRMYPHPDGIPVANWHGRWWVFFKCYECGVETSHRRVVEHGEKI